MALYRVLVSVSNRPGLNSDYADKIKKAVRQHTWEAKVDSFTETTAFVVGEVNCRLQFKRPDISLKELHDKIAEDVKDVITNGTVTTAWWRINPDSPDMTFVTE